MRRLLVNDALNQLGEVTFWNLLQEWFGMEFVGGDYGTLAETVRAVCDDADLIVRNATWFPPIQTQAPTISLLQDIIAEGQQREMQEAVIKSSRMTVFNSAFTASKYENVKSFTSRVIPLPVDFSLFEPQNTMGCQQALSLPDGCVCWIGASQGAAGQVKGFDIFLRVVRVNPDINFVAVFKDALPEYSPPNLRMYCRLTHAELVRVIGACRVGLCTSRTESQHLAGIEMGACGLPMVAPPVGIYWKRDELPGLIVNDSSVTAYTEAIRSLLSKHHDPQVVREHWRIGLDRPFIKHAWSKLIEEAEVDAVVNSHKRDS